MKFNTFIIAGGNSTLLIQGCSLSKKKSIIKKYLGQVEQIGFVETKDDLPFLNMMGGELCINGILAFASTLKKSGLLYSSGLRNPVLYKNNDKSTFIGIAINYNKRENMVLLEGIGYIILKEKDPNPKKLLRNLCIKYSLPAFGILYSRGNQIFPLVFVKETNSLFEETACGSGSIAFNILRGVQEIIQPSNGIIEVNRNGTQFTVGAKVVRIK